MSDEKNEESIIETKDHESVVAYLEFLQNAISRMGENSANTKALTTVLYTIFITVLIAVEKLNQFWWIGLIIVLVGCITDTYYLSIERMFRKKYNAFVKNMNERKLDVKKIYDMNFHNTELKYEVFAEMLDAFKSFSVIAFYGVFVILTVLIKFI